MDTLLHHVKLAVRGFRTAPWTMTAAVLVLALGTGLNTAVFAVAYGVLWRPLPYAEPSRLALVSMRMASIDRDLAIPRGEVDDWVRRLRAFDAVAAYTTGTFTVRGAGGEPRVTDVGLVTRPFFDVLGTRPSLGRAPGADEGLDQAVVSDHFRREWEARGGGALIGRSVTIGDGSFVITGVMPAAFAFPSDRIDIWIDIDSVPGLALLQRRDARSLNLVARLASGVSLAHARDDTQRVIAEIYGPDKITGRVTRHASVVPIGEEQRRTARPVLLAFSVAAALVLIVTCANVATLLVTRTTARAHELAVRLALGATRRRLLVAALGESLVVALAGSAVGVWLAAASLQALTRLGAGLVPRLGAVHLDAPVLIVSLLVAALAAAGAGLMPALHAFRADGATLLGRASATAGRSGRRARAVLVVVQIALSVVLLVGAGLLMRTVLGLLHVDLGVEPRGVLTMRLMLTDSARFDAASRRPFVRELLREVRALPGVQQVGLGGSLPPHVSSLAFTFRFVDERGGRDETVTMGLAPVTPGYLHALGVRFVGGRDFADQDLTADQPVAILSAAAVRPFFREGDPVGKTIPVPRGFSPGGRARVVGIVGDVKFNGLDAPTGSELYVPWDLLPSGIVYLVVRTAGDPMSLAPAIRGAIRALDPALAITDMRAFDDVVRGSIAERRLRGSLAAGFAALALVVALVGLGGVMARAVVERRRELAIRMALGASADRVVRRVVRDGVVLTGVGLVVGLAGAMVATRGLARLVYGVPLRDPLTFAVAGALVAVLSLVACYVPARRAADVEPLELLRSE